MNNHLNYYFQLLEVFTIREIKSRYKASLLGPLWIVIYPLLTTLFLSLIFENIIKIKTEGVPYYVFLLSGMLFWNFFQQGITLAKDSLVWNRELVTKSAFSKEILPLSFILSKIPDFIVNLFILFIFLSISGIQLKLTYIALFFVIIPIIFFTSGIGLFFSLSNAIFRDFGRLIEFFLLIFFYITPILYSEALIPAKFKFLIMINPLSQIIIFTHDLLFKDILRVDLIIYSFLTSIFIFFFGVIFFRKFEKKIVDLI